MTETLARLEDQLTGASLTEREGFLQSLGKGPSSCRDIASASSSTSSITTGACWWPRWAP